jgi:hypothetical protein
MILHLTEEEIIQTLRRSSLTTVIVEGKDDMMIYRWIEKQVGIELVNFLPCGGRQTLLNIFNRRDEFSHIKTIFIADKDTFVYTGIPNEYSDIIWTTGYSIENDLYYGRFAEKLLDINEELKFRIALKNFTTYYAFEYANFQKQLVYNFATHPNQVLDKNHNLNMEYLQDINFNHPTQSDIDFLLSQYEVLLRGKSLFALLQRFLSHRNRDVKHSSKAIFECCIKMSPSVLIEEIVIKIRNALNNALNAHAA